MVTRLLVVTALFLASAGYVGFAMEPERIPLREPLSGMTYELGEWSGRPAPRLTDEVLAVLGVDEYLNRYYASPEGGLAGLYIGYYQTQREGDTIHSPMNCLPGAGWEPEAKGTLTIPVRASRSDAIERPITVNRYVILTPVRNSSTGLDDARGRARAFVQVLFPQLERHLPS